MAVMKEEKKRFVIGLVMGILLLSLCTAQAEETQSPVSTVLDTMIVTATRNEQEDLEIPAFTQVFTDREITEMGAKTVLEVIQSMPDFVVSRSPSGNGLPGFRGVTGYLTFMINGIPIANEGYFQLGSLATSGIERVEVVKGGSAVLYGSDATTGVVNIITKKADENSVSLGAGNNDQRQFTAFLSKFGFSLSYDHYQSEDSGLIYRTTTDYYLDELKRDNINLNYELNEHLNFMFFHSEREATCSKYKANTNTSKGDPWENEQVYNIGQINFAYDDLRVLLYGQERKWDYVNPTGKQKGRYYGVDIQDKWSFWKTTLTAGGNYDQEKSSRLSNGDWLDNDRNRGAVFFLTETNIFSTTKLVLGAREVLSNTTDNVFCPQFQILQRFGESSSLYLNVNKSLREPNLSQIYGYSATQVPNEDLKSEIGWTYEIGWKKRLGKSDMLTLALYHMKIDDRIYSSRTTAGKTIYLNAQEFKNTGAELGYEHNVAKGLFYGAGLAYMDPKQKEDEDGDWEATEQRFGMNLNVGYRFDDAMVNLTARHYSERAEDTDPLWDVSVNASYDLTEKDTFRFHVNNLLDREDALSAGSGSLTEERNFLLTYERRF